MAFPTEIIVLNAKGLQHWIAKMLGLKIYTLCYGPICLYTIQQDKPLLSFVHTYTNKSFVHTYTNTFRKFYLFFSYI